MQAIIGHKGPKESATKVRRTAADPAARLHDAVLRYQDTLGFAVQRRLGFVDLTELDPNGPIPWLSRIPVELTTDARWEDYLRDCAHLVSSLASHIAVPATAAWAQGLDPNVVRRSPSGERRTPSRHRRPADRGTHRRHRLAPAARARLQNRHQLHTRHAAPRLVRDAARGVDGDPAARVLERRGSVRLTV